MCVLNLETWGDAGKDMHVIDEDFVINHLQLNLQRFRIAQYIAIPRVMVSGHTGNKPLI